jgi:hypothetical protein
MSINVKAMLKLYKTDVQTALEDQEQGDKVKLFIMYLCKLTHHTCKVEERCQILCVRVPDLAPHQFGKHFKHQAPR